MTIGWTLLWRRPHKSVRGHLTIFNAVSVRIALDGSGKDYIDAWAATKDIQRAWMT